MHTPIRRNRDPMVLPDISWFLSLCESCLWSSFQPADSPLADASGESLLLSLVVRLERAAELRDPCLRHLGEPAPAACPCAASDNTYDMYEYSVLRWFGLSSGSGPPVPFGQRHGRAGRRDVAGEAQRDAGQLRRRGAGSRVGGFLQGAARHHGELARARGSRGSEARFSVCVATDEPAGNATGRVPVTFSVVTPDAWFPFTVTVAVVLLAPGVARVSTSPLNTWLLVFWTDSVVTAPGPAAAVQGRRHREEALVAARRHLCVPVVALERELPRQRARRPRRSLDGPARRRCGYQTPLRRCRLAARCP